MKMKLALAALVVVSAGLLSGCAATVHVATAANATNVKCADVSVNLPNTVSTLGERVTDGQGTGAWGTPAEITLQCGVPVPDPTSTLVCVTVNGVDWLRKADSHGVYAFTTYGRNPAVTVLVNSLDVKADANQALTDLSSAVAEIPGKHRCVAPNETLQNGEPVNTSTPTPSPTPTKKP
jgi:hypothetical protein